MTITSVVSPPLAVVQQNADRLTVVTAADQAYWRCLYQFLRSAERLNLNMRHDVVAYDFGLDAATRRRVQARFPWCEWRTFAFNNYPPHIGANLRAHAWKPFVIQEVLQSTSGLVLWLDSATLFREILDDVMADIRRFGVYSLKGQSTLGAHCDPDILRALSVSPELARQPERVSGVLGFDTGNPAARKLVSVWCDHHRVPGHVRAATATHKSDQALLSIAMLEMEAAGELTLTDGEIDISSRNPVRWVTSRNKVPTWLPPQLDFAPRAYYAIYKAADRANLQWRHRGASLANGLHRLPKEHFTVFVASATTKNVVEITAPALSYYADPFVWRHRGQAYLLCEEFRYPRHKGFLRSIPLDADLHPGTPHTIVARESHSSFPFLFEDRGTLYLVPETSTEGGVHLYRCDVFPRRWTRERTLLAAVDAADTVVFSHDGRWWLITSIRTRPDDAARSLAVFFTDNLLIGKWHPHPVNDRKLYADLPFSSGRNAGAVIRAGRRLLRPSQHNPNYYGEAIRWMEIEQLTETEYRECELTGTHPLAKFSARVPMHHLTIHGDLIAWDVRDRAGFARHASAQAKESRRLCATGLDGDTADAVLSLS
jgi:hypothetical protein